MMDRLLENNTVLKVLSVIVAIFIWFQAGAASSTTISRAISPVAVGFPSIQPGLTVLSVSPANVTVEIKGTPSAVESSTTASQVSASVILSSVKGPGTYLMKVSASVPPGMGVVSVTPGMVDVTVAKMGQQKAPVSIHVAGSPAIGYELSGYQPNITEATISGPTGALSQVKDVVGTLTLDARKSPFTRQVVLHAVNAQGAVVPRVLVDPPTASVSATIQLRPPQKVLPVIGQLSGQPAPGYKVTNISVYPSSVTLSGTKHTLASIAHVYATPVSIAGATTSKTVSVPVVVPKGTTLVSAGQVTVSVTIQSSS